MSCIVCGKKMSKEEQEPEPHNVCTKCFWKEANKQKSKRYKPKFNLLAPYAQLNANQEKEK